SLYRLVDTFDYRYFHGFWRNLFMVAYTLVYKGVRSSAKGKFTFCVDCHIIFAGYVYRTVSGACFTGRGPSGGSRSFLDSLAALLSQVEACLTPGYLPPNLRFDIHIQGQN